MPNDHFLARTYLKHFGDPSLNGMLHAYRKSNGQNFQCWPKDVCHEWDGDDNPEFFKNNPGILGDFRAMFEPTWDSGINDLHQRRINGDMKFRMSALIANFMACNPTWRRIAAKMFEVGLKHYMSFAKDMKEKHGGQPELPVEAIELMEQGRIVPRANPEMIKGMLTTQLMDHTFALYTQEWVVLENDTDEPFLTADYPTPMDEPTREFINQRYITLSPTVAIFIPVRRGFCAVRLKPETMREQITGQPMGPIRFRKAMRQEVKMINVLVVESAEEFVFSSRSSVAISGLVQKYKNHRLDVDFLEVPSATEEDAFYLGHFIRTKEVPAHQR